MKNTITVAAVLAALVGFPSGLVACGDGDETTTVTETAPATTTESSTSTSSTTSTTTDSTSTTTDSTTTGSTTTESEDVSGNCDEAEHADDPECAAGGVEAGDSSGSGSGGYGPG